MLEFRRSLPAFKEKDALLKAISENQVTYDSLITIVNYG
jgi:HrpA-like RNA helicase